MLTFMRCGLRNDHVSGRATRVATIAWAPLDRTQHYGPLRDDGLSLTPHPPVLPAGDEAMVVDGPEAMDERLQDDEREDDDDTDVVTRDAVAADENVEEHNPDDRASRRRR